MIAPLRKGSKLVVPVRELRPTQMTIGWYHVEQKMQVTRHTTSHRRHALLDRHRVNVVIGPDHVLYVVDGHHWARAWRELDIHLAPALVQQDLSRVPETEFWERMREDKLVHPYDEHGELRPLSSLPLRLEEMRDDPYRSLEAFARMAGGYRKVKEAYSDFRWADFFRREIAGPLDTQDLFADALARAIRLARSDKARDLPGYVGNGASAPSDRR